ncbi:hypothetical protein ScPMuIL_012049 [Solemya velum]
MSQVETLQAHSLAPRLRKDSPTNLRPSVFEKILQSCTTAVDPESLQMELHYRSKNPFQTGNEKDDSSLDTSQPLNKPQSEIGSRRRSPLTTSGGIITKRGPVVEQVEVPFELKLNVTETQFVVVEDSASWDTNAVILKSTAVMSYRPNSRDKILSCSLQSLEVFSCSLVAEEETALSIIDPMTISIELNANPLPEPKVIQPIGLLDAQGINDNNVLLEINFNTMNIRLSYHDMKMFLAILNSLPQQALSASQMQSASTNSRYSKSLLRSLEELGFTMADCMKALDVCKGDRDEAAIWLLDNAKSVKIVKKKKEKQLSPTGIELKATCVCLCLIDDCRDADVPLAELSFNGVSFHQKLEPHIEGRATFQLLGDYYNRSLSGWEPFLEPWRCNTEWKDYKDKRNNKLAVQISASDVMNLNLTSACIEQYQKTKMTWTEDYYRGQRFVMDVSSSQRRRNPFIPFVLKNQTGCVLWFLTVTVSPSRNKVCNDWIRSLATNIASSAAGIHCFVYHYLKHPHRASRIFASVSTSFSGADLSQAIELGIQLENFETCRELVIPPGTTKYKVKLRIYDSSGRLLELVIRITAKIGGSLWLTISAPYWLVNKSGLPLVFRQDGARTDSAGQFEEHELARSLTPLLFSFADKESANLCSMRIGKSVHGPVASPQWCHRFSLESGVGMRQLHVVSRMANRPDWVYNIGIKVQQGRGRYRDTNIVTFAPRFQIDNQSSHKLAIAQRHLTKDQAIPNPEGHLTALPKCKLPFHWPRLDLDQLLCVKLMDQANIHWSGGFRIDRIYSSHINMRDDEGNSFLLKVEVVLQGPTFFIVFADAEEMPPPFRIDNFSEVPIMYYQTSTVEEELKSYIKPHTNLRYAWDEPTLDPFITLSVRGGTSGTYNMNKLEEGEQLCYENFIFLGATATFNRQRTAGVDLTGEDLVMDCIHSSYIVFRKKEVGKRSQFWRMTSHGMLEHEGSAPPRDPRKSSTSLGHSMVLDIADIAPQPGKCVPLTLRKPDERRCSTQTWRFTNDGRLCCAAGNLSVQAMGNLQEGAVAVLGPGPSSDSKLAIPEIMQVSCQKSRPGSGLLSVRVHMDGPVRVLQITDICNRQLKQRPDHEFAEWQVYEETSKTQSEVKKMDQDRNIEVSLQLKGIGLSLVNQQPEELLYALLRNIMIDYTATPTSVTVDASVANIQVDNQLFGTQRTVMLHITPTSKSDVPDNTPALHIAAQRVPHNEWNADIYKYMVISMKKLTLQLEERLLWKLLQFIGFGEAEGDIHKLDDKECDSNRALVAATSVKTKRYYFGILKINTSRVTLSMLTASKLSADLESIKHALSVPLIRFEEAKVDIDPFIRHHPFETSKFLFQEVLLHYTEELKSQAAKILGSVDFLGNPLGLFNDVTEGISGLIKDGNVGGLLKNVTHGVSNSAAKVASSLSDGVGKLNFDSKHNDAREVIRNQHSGSSGGHLVAGVKGLGYGFVGGLTSIFTQTYEGVKDDGIEGLFTGFGKGLVGTVTKPVTGVLDLASGAAHAVRDTSRSTSRAQPPRMREPRCCYGPGGLLPLYSRHQAAAQKVLHIINKNKFDEFFIAMEQLRGGREDNLHALISSKKVYFLRDGEHDPENIVLMVSHDELLNARQVETNAKHYIEMVMKGGNGGGAGSLRRPQVRCDKQLIAQRVSQQVNYAKNLFDEHNHTLLVDSPQEDWD